MISILTIAAAAAELPPICADRPAKANAVCTVPPGHLQVETGLADWSLTKVGGTRITVLTIAPTTVKLGLTGGSDLEVVVTPYAKMNVKHDCSVSGFGDLVVRHKQGLTGASAPVQVAAIPFVKLPTAAHGLGNGRVEGGLAAPVTFALSGTVTMTLGPEADLLADGEGHGRHVAVVNLVNIAGPIAPRLILAGELWSNLNFEPAGTIKQASADLALAYAISDDVQLDGGSNLGLTRETPDVEFYAGISFRL